MLSANPLSQRLTATAFVLAMIATFGLQMRAQEPAAVNVGDTKVTGLPSDWSHRHVIYGNPGTEQDAIRNGTHEQWQRIVNDPRYVVQNLKKGLPVQGPAHQDVEMRQRIAQQEFRTRGPRDGRSFRHGKPDPASVELHRDWSMNTGGTAAGLTLNVGTPGAGTVSGTSQLSIDGVTFLASPPTKASETGTFTGNPATGQNVTINGQNITASDSTAGTQFGSFSTYPPAAASAITVKYKGNTLTLTTNGTGQNLVGTAGATVPASNTQITLQSGSNTLTLNNGGTFSSDTATFGKPMVSGSFTVTSGATTTTFTSNGITSVTIAGGMTNGDTLQIGGTGITYLFESSQGSCGTTNRCVSIASGNRNTIAGTLLNAIGGACYNSAGCPGGATADPNVSAAVLGGNNVVYLLNKTAGSLALTFTPFNFGARNDLTTSSGTVAVATAANTCAGAAGTFIPSLTTTTEAQNLQAAIVTPCPAADGFSSTQTTNSVTFKATTPGSATGPTPTWPFSGTNSGDGAVTWGGASGGGNGNSTCGGSSTLGTFATSGTQAGLASSISTAITNCNAANAAVGATSLYSGTNTFFTLTSTIPGTFPTFVGGGVNLAGIFSWGTATGGFNGSNVCGSSTTGHYITDASTTNLAINLSAAINMCTGATGITTTSAPSGTSVTVTATQWGATPGVNLGSSGGFFAWNATTMAGGADGTTAANSFAVDNVFSDNAANLATAIGLTTGTGVTAANTAGSPTLTITSVALGSGASGIVTTAPTGFAWEGGTVGAGTPGTNGTADTTHFTYWTTDGTDTYVDSPTLATNLATALNANGTVSGAITATANNPTSGTVVLTAKIVGTGGNSYTTTATNFGAITPTSGKLGGGLGGGYPGVYPAKYGLSSEGAVNCAGDYVVYPTGVTGSGASATIIAYNNIYSSCTAPVPTVDWSYNTGPGTVVTSPVISYYGDKVAFIETQSSTAAVLRLLQFASGNGTDYSNPVAPTGAFTNTIVGAGGNTAWSGCTGSCMISVAMQNNDTDTNSSPFYDATSDSIYVGDDAGVLHRFTGVFLGTPAEVTTGGWPLSLGGKLTSPVIDPITGSVFVGSSNGILYQIKTPQATPTKVTSNAIAVGTGIVDSPLVDTTSATTSVVYVFVGDDNNGSFHSAVYQFANNFANATSGSTLSMGRASGNLALTVYDGDFDNKHYSTTGGTAGNLYFCGGTVNNALNPTLYTIGLNANFANSSVTAAETLTNGAATCSPATEFYNTGAGALTTLVAPGPTTVASTTLANLPNLSAGATQVYLNSYTGVAAGDYLLIGTEDMYVVSTGTGFPFGEYLNVTRGVPPGTGAAVHNNGVPVTVFTDGVSAASPTITVTSGTGIQKGDYILVDAEIMLVTGGGGTTTLNVTRGALGTTPAGHLNGAPVSAPAYDWLFLSVTANGNDAACTGSCVYSFSIGNPLGTGSTAAAGFNAAGGTTGIVIDNGFTSTGASQIYYSTLSGQACSGQNDTGPVGAGSGVCAVQLSQAGLQ